MDEYVMYGEKFYTGVNIQDMYRFVFSDQATCPLNNGSFGEYLAQRLKNKNYKSTKYNASGPGYYTGNPEVTFANSPLFSTRNSELDHPLPKIPFLPK